MLGFVLGNCRKGVVRLGEGPSGNPVVTRGSLYSRQDIAEGLPCVESEGRDLPAGQQGWWIEAGTVGARDANVQIGGQIWRGLSCSIPCGLA